MVCEDREEKPVLKALQPKNRMQSKVVEVRRKDDWALGGPQMCVILVPHAQGLQVNH